MEFSLTRAWLRCLALALAALTLAGCAAMSPATGELAVRERANAHWKARLANDLDAAYGFMPPSYRAVTTPEAYKRNFGGAVNFISAQVERVKCESAEKCVATNRIEARAALARASAPPITTYFDEVWVRENGQWWLFPTP